MGFWGQGDYDAMQGAVGQGGQGIPLGPPPGAQGTPLPGGDQPFAQYTPYVSNAGKASLVPYGMQNAAADAVGAVMNAWIGKKQQDKMKDMQTAESAFKLIQMGFPADMILQDSKTFKAIERVTGITLPKDTEGKPIPPEESTRATLSKMMNKFLHGGASSDESQRMMQAGAMPGMQQLLNTQVAGEYDVAGRDMMAKSAQFQKYAEIANSALQQYGDVNAARAIAGAIAYKDPLPKDFKIPMSADQRKLSKDYFKTLADTFGGGDAASASTIAPILNMAADTLAKGEKIDYQLARQLGPSYTALLGAAEINLKGAQAGLASAQTKKTGVDTAKGLQELTTTVSFGGKTLPIKMMQDYLAIQKVAKELDQDPELDSKIKMLVTQYQAGNAGAVQELDRLIMQKFGLQAEERSSVMQWIRSWWPGASAAEAFSGYKPIVTPGDRSLMQGAVGSPNIAPPVPPMPPQPQR